MKIKRLISAFLILTFIFASIIGLSATAPDSPSPLKVHYIDVGQADSILIQLPNKQVALIDAGNNDDSDTVVKYIKKLGIKKIDYLFGTHPHEDHIGGLDAVIKSFDIGKVYMPKASATTDTFMDVLTALKSKGLNVTAPVPDTNLISSKELKFIILAPNSNKYDEANEYSIVLKLIYGKTSFLFTGDAEKVSENEMLDKKYDLKADVLKVGHHGGRTSTNTAFLKAVSPKYAIISVGKDNDYGHPTKDVLKRLAAVKAEILRTDLSGTIVATSDSNKITFNKEAAGNENAPKPKIDTPAKPVIEKPAEPEKASDALDSTVYITKSGKKYHRDGCPSLSNSKIPIKLSEAIKKGYKPCNDCKP